MGVPLAEQRCEAKALCGMQRKGRPCDSSAWEGGRETPFASCLLVAQGTGGTYVEAQAIDVRGWDVEGVASACLGADQDEKTWKELTAVTAKEEGVRQASEKMHSPWLPCVRRILAEGADRLALLLLQHTEPCARPLGIFASLR